MVNNETQNDSRRMQKTNSTTVFKYNDKNMSLKNRTSEEKQKPLPPQTMVAKQGAD